MLTRLITAISLLVFALLMMSGSHIEIALHRSVVVFLVLFAGIYLTIFIINIIQDSPGSHAAALARSSSGNGRRAGTRTGPGNNGTNGAQPKAAGNSKNGKDRTGNGERSKPAGVESDPGGGAEDMTDPKKPQ